MNTDTDALHSEFRSKSNFQISDVLSESRSGASVLVPYYGWVIFGGIGNSLSTTQKLQTLIGSWTVGPNLYQNESDYGSCGLQVERRKKKERERKIKR